MIFTNFEEAAQYLKNKSALYEGEQSRRRAELLNNKYIEITHDKKIFVINQKMIDETKLSKDDVSYINTRWLAIYPNKVINSIQISDKIYDIMKSDKEKSIEANINKIKNNRDAEIYIYDLWKKINPNEDKKELKFMVEDLVAQIRSLECNDEMDKDLFFMQFSVVGQFVQKMESAKVNKMPLSDIQKQIIVEFANKINKNDSIYSLKNSLIIEKSLDEDDTIIINKTKEDFKSTTRFLVKFLGIDLENNQDFEEAAKNGPKGIIDFLQGVWDAIITTFKSIPKAFGYSSATPMSNQIIIHAF